MFIYRNVRVCSAQLVPTTLFQLGLSSRKRPRVTRLVVSHAVFLYWVFETTPCTYANGATYSSAAHTLSQRVSARQMCSVLFASIDSAKNTTKTPKIVGTPGMSQEPIRPYCCMCFPSHLAAFCSSAIGVIQKMGVISKHDRCKPVHKVMAMSVLLAW